MSNVSAINILGIYKQVFFIQHSQAKLSNEYEHVLTHRLIDCKRKTLLFSDKHAG